MTKAELEKKYEDLLERYHEAEIKTDRVLTNLVRTPRTLLIAVAVIVGAFALGAWVG